MATNMLICSIGTDICNLEWSYEIEFDKVIDRFS